MSHDLTDGDGRADGRKKEIIPSDFPSSDIISEKNIWQILKASFTLPKSSFNLLLTGAFFAVMVLHVLFTDSTFLAIKNTTLEWAERGFNFSTGILGFLIAGLAIFTAVNDITLFTNMARVRHESGMSYLKYNFLSLMYVFIIYIGLVILCFLIQVLGQDNGVFSTILDLVVRVYPKLNLGLSKFIISKSAFVVVCTLFFYCLILLKTFVFNIYHLMMVNIYWKFEEENGWEDDG